VIHWHLDSTLHVLWCIAENWRLSVVGGVAPSFTTNFEPSTVAFQHAQNNSVQLVPSLAYELGTVEYRDWQAVDL
jgi:hypothetical protein